MSARRWAWQLEMLINDYKLDSQSWCQTLPFLNVVPAACRISPTLVIACFVSARTPPCTSSVLPVSIPICPLTYSVLLWLSRAAWLKNKGTFGFCCWLIPPLSPPVGSDRSRRLGRCDDANRVISHLECWKCSFVAKIKTKFYKQKRGKNIEKGKWWMEREYS